MSFEEETEKIADQSRIELLPLNLNDDNDDEPAKKSDIGSYHSDGSLGSLGITYIDDDIDTGARVGGAKGKRRPRVQLIQVCIYFS